MQFVPVLFYSTNVLTVISFAAPIGLSSVVSRYPDRRYKQIVQKHTINTLNRNWHYYCYCYYYY